MYHLGSAILTHDGPLAGRAARLATALYVLWGVLHLGLGVVMLMGSPPADPPQAELAAESRMFFVCAVVFGAQAIAVALAMNRVNSRFGHWLNLLTLGAVDLAFVVVLVVPGHVDLVGGLSGPVIWLLAATASAVARHAGSGPGQRHPDS
ncbi:hypothetical protein ACTMSW_15115 [Micromonospora sp. BQ11]|uniref:hypothetical protein n=1 Tax=Micromonospora sp. BQ11 TaxID=3452212 RepID=UPI003F8C4D5A